MRGIEQIPWLYDVRSHRPWQARLQDIAQPAWNWLTGGCHPNRRTEAAGFRIEPSSRLARGSVRRFVALPEEP